MKHSILAIIIAVAIVSLLILTYSREEYVLFTIDTEGDLPPYLNTSIGLDEGLPKLIDLFEKYGVRATFLVTGNVALDHPNSLLLIKNNNHEIGAHGLYHENFTELSYAEKERRVKETTRIIINVTGEKPVSFRAPYHSADTELVNILQAQGYLVEASASDKSYPYHPSEKNWLEDGSMNLLRVPVSHTPYLFYPSSLYNMSWIDAYNNAINSQFDKSKKIVVIGLHPWELVDISYNGQEVYTRAAGDYTISNLTALLKYLKSRNVKFITATELYRLLKN